MIRYSINAVICFALCNNIFERYIKIKNQLELLLFIVICFFCNSIIMSLDRKLEIIDSVN